MGDKRRDKRFKREHRVKVVYTPKTQLEGQRRVDKAKSLVGTPFVRMPGNREDSEIVLTTSDGTPIPVEAVEMVFNDMLLMDAVSDWGKDGPLYETTCDKRQLEVLEFAKKAYIDVEIPMAYRKPQ